VNHAVKTSRTVGTCRTTGLARVRRGPSLRPGASSGLAEVSAQSDVLVEVLGDRGRAARSAVGMAERPIGIAVEIEAVVQIRT
jgi:hypothetical protein